MDNEYLVFLIKWLNERDKRERLGLLVLGCLFITLLWYLLLEKPLNHSRLATQQETLSLQKEIAFYNSEANNILLQSAKNEQQRKYYSASSAKFSALNIHFASPQGRDFIINSILNPHPNIQIISLKNVPVEKTKTIPVPGKLNAPITDIPPIIARVTEDEGYELVFNSDFISTVHFLEKMENLQWCLSWDSLEYAVQTYPAAEITVALHVVGG
jgi:hypothetical protein